MSRRDGILVALVVGSLAASGGAQESATPVVHAVTDAHATTAGVLWQPSMNVFRRFDVPAERMYEFYGGVLGFKQLSTLNVGNGGGVARFQAGRSGAQAHSACRRPQLRRRRRARRDGLASADILFCRRGGAHGELRAARAGCARVHQLA